VSCGYCGCLAETCALCSEYCPKAAQEVITETLIGELSPWMKDDNMNETQEVVTQVLKEDAERKPVVESGDKQKLDHGKAPWHLAPWDAFKCIVLVLAFGAAKYRERGWEEGMQWSRLFSAAQRHLTDWFHNVDKGKGAGKDADTGYSDLWHAACCVCFLIAYELRGGKHLTNDDRPKL
jgi:dATP/dGTP diphosphohydrolase